MMRSVEDLHTLVSLLNEFNLPISPILEFAIKEKENELMQSVRTQNNAKSVVAISGVVKEGVKENNIKESVKSIERIKPNIKKTTILRVIRSNGSIIEDRRAYVTMGTAIQEIGVESVHKLDLFLDGMNIIMDGANPIYPGRNYYLGDKYYLNTHSSTKSKAKFLEKMFKSLRLDWKVEIVSSEG